MIYTLRKQKVELPSGYRGSRSIKITSPPTLEVSTTLNTDERVQRPSPISPSVPILQRWTLHPKGEVANHDKARREALKIILSQHF